MRVLLATPFSPLLSHDHAAADLAAPFAKALAERVDLHVVAPMWHLPNAPRRSEVVQQDGYTTHHVAVGRRGPWRLALDRYPVSLRQAWPHRLTAEVWRLLESGGYDIVHGEYLATAEAMLGHEIRSSITLHDLLQHQPTSWGGKGRSRLRNRFWWRQHQHAVEVEKRVVGTVDCVFTLSSVDAEAATNLGVRAVATNPGLVKPAAHWKSAPLDRSPPTMLFAGALWRKVNEDAVLYLANEVLPQVRLRVPNAVLRVIGARPTRSLIELAATTDGLDLIGAVPSFEVEYARAQVVLAPALVPAGILMKAIVPLMVGAPVMLNSNSARSIDGLVAGLHACVADDTQAWISGTVRLLCDRTAATEMGRAARVLMSTQYSPQTQAGKFVTTWESLPR